MPITQSRELKGNKGRWKEQGIPNIHEVLNIFKAPEALNIHNKLNIHEAYEALDIQPPTGNTHSGPMCPRNANNHGCSPG